jgi:hypothetical protein
VAHIANVVLYLFWHIFCCNLFSIASVVFMKKALPAITVMLCLSFFACKKEKGNAVPTNTTTTADTPASLSYIDYTGHQTIGSAICFFARATGAKSYLWDFGDGNSSTDAQPCHIYTDTGLYTVNLKINNDTTLTAHTFVYISKVPLYTNLLAGTRTWRHTTGVSLSSGFDTSYPAPPATFAITYIDPVTVGIGSLTFTYQHVVPSYDSVLLYTSSAQNSSGHETSRTILFVHSSAGDSISYRIWDQESAGGVSTEGFYWP